jgi:small GTP-binding protein
MDEGQFESLMPTYKVIVLGLSQAGKSKLLTRYIYGCFEEKGTSTYGIDCSYVKRKKARFAYFDTAGQEQYRNILNLYFKGSDAAILVYSVNDEASFREMAFYRSRIEEEEPECRLFIIGCKSDL